MDDHGPQPIPLFLRIPRAEVSPLRFPSMEALPRIGAQQVEALRFLSVDAVEAPVVAPSADEESDAGFDGAFGEAANEAEAPQVERPNNIVAITVQAFAEGFSQGRDEGRAAAQYEVRTAIGYLLSAAEGVRGHREKTVATLQAELVELALSIAERVLRAEASVAGNALAMRLAEAAIARLGDCQRVTVRMAPADLRELGPRSSSGQERIVYLADPSLARGDTLVESEHGRVDARLQTQLDELATALRAPSVEGEGAPPRAEGAR